MKKPLKITLITVASLIGALVVGALGYVGYIYFSYYRIGDIDLNIDHKSSLDNISTNTTYKVMTYNIGFGAYSQDFTFFMDSGYDDEGNPTIGYYSKAKSKEEVEFNINGAIETTKSLNPDFVLFQEVDVSSTRSFYLNQHQMIVDNYEQYDNVFANNFHTAYLPYPLYDMHGAVEAGLTTLSKYKIDQAERKQYTVSSSLSKFFDLDRCFSVSKIKVNEDKNLYLVNSHMSAYDEGGVIREKQMEELNQFLSSCKENNDYVIVGGDFNHDLLTNNPDFNYDANNRPFSMTKKTPDWVSYFFNDGKKSPLIDGYKVFASDNEPTCRNNDIEWEENKTFVCVVDGFIVSNNINVIKTENIATNNGNKGLNGFAYSDHQPVYLEFQLEGTTYAIQR